MIKRYRAMFLPLSPEMYKISITDQDWDELEQISKLPIFAALISKLDTMYSNKDNAFKDYVSERYAWLEMESMQYHALSNLLDNKMVKSQTVEFLLRNEMGRLLDYVKWAKRKDKEYSAEDRQREVFIKTRGFLSDLWFAKYQSDIGKSEREYAILPHKEK